MWTHANGSKRRDFIATLGRGSGLAACRAQQPAIAGDWGFLKAHLARLTLAFDQALNEASLSPVKAR